MASVTILTSGMDERLLDRACLVEAVLLVLVAEVGHGRLDDPTGGVAETAQAAPPLQALLNAIEERELDLGTLVGEDPFVGPDRPVAAHPAGRALAAGFVGVKA